MIKTKPIMMNKMCCRHIDCHLNLGDHSLWMKNHYIYIAKVCSVSEVVTLITKRVDCNL